MKTGRPHSWVSSFHPPIASTRSLRGVVSVCLSVCLPRAFITQQGQDQQRGLPTTIHTHWLSDQSTTSHSWWGLEHPECSSQTEIRQKFSSSEKNSRLFMLDHRIMNMYEYIHFLKINRLFTNLFSQLYHTLCSLFTTTWFKKFPINLFFYIMLNPSSLYHKIVSLNSTYGSIVRQ